MSYKIIEIKYSSLSAEKNECEITVHDQIYDKISAYQKCIDFYLIQLSDFEIYIDLVKIFKLYPIEDEDFHEEGFVYWEKVDSLKNEEMYKEIYDYIRDQWVKKSGKFDFYCIRQIEMILV